MTRAHRDMLGNPQVDVKTPDDEIDLGKLFGALWRGKLWIALFAFLALLGGSYYAVGVATPLYTTTTSVALESRQEQVVDIESVVSGLSGDQIAINTEVEVLKSRRLIGKVVDDLGLMNDPEFNVALRDQSGWSLSGAVGLITQGVFGQTAASQELSNQAIQDAVINELLDRVSVSNVRQSYVFRISVVSEGREKAAQIANRLAELYVEDQIVLKFERTAEATEWLTERVAELQIELETSENSLKDFSSNTDLISPEGLVALNRQLKELRDRQADISATVMEANARVAELTAAQDTGDLTQMAVAARSPELDRLLLNDDQTIIRQQFENRYTEIVDRAVLERTRAQAQLATVEISTSEIAESISTQSGELVTLQQFQREAEASRLIYEFFLARLKETSVQQGLQQAESRILSYAVTPTQPSSPRTPLIVMLSLVLGVLAGSGLVLLRELSQNTFRTAEDLELMTGYSVLGQIPTVPSRNRGKLLQYLQDKPNSAAAEAIRNLRTSILLANLDKAPQLIMSTSSVPGEGKTTQSIALALNLAGLGKKVLLIEGDIRRRVMNEYFDIAEKKGFLSVMLGEASLEEALTHLPDMKFDVLLGETSQSNAADIFSSEKFRNFLDSLREKYDYVIVDTPPVLAVTDARIIGRWVDSIIYTVQWDKTSHRQVLEGLRSFEQVKLKVSGLVLGQVSARGMKRYGYGESYDAYQAYYGS